MLNTKFVINSIEREKEIVDMVNKNINFFRTNRIVFTFPEKTVEEEYDIKKHENYKEWLETEWAKRENEFTERLLFLFNKSIELQFTVEISNYGPLGFYNTNTNTVTINLNTKLDVISTIKHEMIHIILEPFIRKYQIEHARKEFIIDTILKILDTQVNSTT
ncbi:MAG: hypothetical protein A2V69_02980 [Candidatus Portnoybacteria bacterium RBG_13_40_8]|uniref:Uncharacterized protein n=1 Tax=Candidatus Portnoybacteria bacterium RBG_13_40_8 TaxID=1801990 RepID=A0A1G2F592_9BACT|nr:MAG: hypothetical protein A2V69_02980 [Candidatus Portnoybacteria bacterium RBG_13_40_8]OGZ35531.1 MAG: hypothetical protein A2V60_02410 [Candidatus Portnoybacteria bacterium RIFCSPHIGHO2_01_FULL_39_19]